MNGGVAMSRKGGLGKGLDALLPENAPSQVGGAALFVPTHQVVPNPRQPRLIIRESDLNDLAESIREHGIIQPLIVTQDIKNDLYILIAGERRLRAAAMAGLDTVPVIIRHATDQEMLEIALIENVQRADLSPLETAEAFRHLEEDFGLKHEEIAARVGKSRAAVTNTLRLLKLPEPVQSALNAGLVSEGHARALLALSTPQAQASALQTILKLDLTVRQTEELVRKLNGAKPAAHIAKDPPAEIRDLEEMLMQSTGTRVSLRHGKKGGTVTFHYYSEEELEALIQRITRE